MAVEINSTDNQKLSSLDTLLNKAEIAIDLLNDHLDTLNGVPTNLQVVGMVEDLVRHQKHIIRVLSNHLKESQ